MNGDESVIGWLTDPKVSDPAFSGGKGASLATLARAGLPVPDGFVVSTDAYRRFVREQALARATSIGRDRIWDDMSETRK